MFHTLPRFWAKVDRSGGPDACWLWTASRDRKGYGQFNHAGRMVKAHRLSLELARGRRIPRGRGHHGVCVLHKCDVRHCVNPAHLELGTVADNNRDMAEKGRAARPNAFLSPDQVRAMRWAYGTGLVSTAELGRWFGVTQSNAWRVVASNTWRSA